MKDPYQDLTDEELRKGLAKFGIYPRLVKNEQGELVEGYYLIDIIPVLDRLGILWNPENN
jgi:hypothetical protein